jgi:hypothetical protein
MSSAPETVARGWGALGSGSSGCANPEAVRQAKLTLTAVRNEAGEEAGRIRWALGVVSKAKPR